jgi:hypothetical protein
LVGLAGQIVERLPGSDARLYCGLAEAIAARTGAVERRRRSG